MHFWQANYLMLILIFLFPPFKEMFLILPRRPTWYNGCRDLIQTIPSRKYLQVKDPFITLPLPLNACHIECGLCLLLFSSLYAESSLDFAKFKSWAESFFHTRHLVLGVFLLWSLCSTGGGGLEVLDVWSWISTVCCSPLKGSWDQFACCLVMVKKGSYWFMMFSLIAKLRTYCECDHITIMTPCSAKVLLYLKTLNLITLVSVFWQGRLLNERTYPFHFPLWCCCFTHPCCSFFYSWPYHLCLWPVGGLTDTRCSVSVGTWSAAMTLSALAKLLLVVRNIFPCEKLHPFSHHTIFASFVYFRFRNKNKGKTGMVHVEGCVVVLFTWLRQYDISLTTMSPAARRGAVYTHYIFGLFSPCACLTWLVWFVRVCVCACVCVLYRSVNWQT